MRSSIASTARSVPARAFLLAAAIAAASVVGAETPPPAADADGLERFLCSAEPWAGDDVRFVTDMLLKWRPDYQKLSTGEFRVYVRDVLLGLQPPGERYTIDTTKRGSILFERKDGDIFCTMRQP
ncbi:MAG: hypothetical protein IT574_05775 [Candidatus Aureabacteria bacterium]|nr:hypothetical protein [Candidatus Auribacterota bacterium]NLW94901.1 hypothetical protein [Chlamydiota bacterium]HOE26572.1 hypothetical protein [bacterium]HQM53206.1 hypothetical protein [bacterium]